MKSIQELDIEEVPSLRRNPYIADIFHRLDYVERRGSGLKKITEETKLLYGYTDNYKPEFRSSRRDFRVILKNMNYSAEVSAEVKLDDIRLNSLLEFCRQARTRKEMQVFCDIRSDEYFSKNIIKPLLKAGKIRMTNPDKPKSRNQKYITLNKE